MLISFDEKSHFIELEVISTNESFSFDLANALVERTENHFFNLRRGKAQKAVNSFEYKVDSLKTEIDETQWELALNSDMGNALIYSIDKVRNKKLMIELEALKIAYSEYIKGLELSRIEIAESRIRLSILINLVSLGNRSSPILSLCFLSHTYFSLSFLIFNSG